MPLVVTLLTFSAATAAASAVCALFLGVSLVSIDRIQCASCESSSGSSSTTRPGRQPPVRLTCATVLCLRGSQCRMVSGKPQCICNDMCPAIYDPVCGTDGKDYSNSCTLEVAACKQQSGAQVAYKGKCTSDEAPEQEEPQEAEMKPERDPCAIVRCGWGAQCQVVEGKAKCECPMERCPNNIQGVCGSDGKTYATDCDLRAEACKNKADIQVAHQGACTSSDTTGSSGDNS